MNSKHHKKKTADSKENPKIIYKKIKVAEDHEEHVDERWLVSYSDMMTLLFGLFVMLYSMQSPEAVKKVQESIQKEFNGTEKKNEEKPNLEVELIKAQEKIETLKGQLQKIQDENKKLTESNKPLDIKSDAKYTEEEMQVKEIELVKLRSEILQKEDEIKKLLAQNEEMQKLIKELSERKNKEGDFTKDYKKEFIESKNLNQVITQENTELKKNVAQLQITSAEQKNEINRLNEIIKELEKKLSNLDQKGSFLAIVTSWSTTDHDLDMVVTDPNGKVFNFKKKQYTEYPGKFVLDTRRGPGAEVWQSNKIITGQYKLEVVFYSQYGNQNPAEGKVSIFSSKSDLDIPLNQLKSTGKKQIFLLNIKQDGSFSVE